MRCLTSCHDVSQLRVVPGCSTILKHYVSNASANEPTSTVSFCVLIVNLKSDLLRAHLNLIFHFMPAL